MSARIAAVAALLAACSGGGAPTRRAHPPDPPAVLPAPGDVEEVIISTTGSCARLAGGRALCWGAWGGSLIKVATAAADLRDVAALRVGHDIELDPQRYNDHLCYLDGRGRASCWGNDEQGQLGNAARGDAPTPGPVESLPPVARLALGKRHSCALTREGQVLCWGANGLGEAGAGEGVTEVPAPRVVVGLPRAVHLAAGASHTCALTEDRRVYCWGSNFNDQCDARDEGPIAARAWTPHEVAIARGVRTLAAASSTTCGLREGGAVCWGFVRDLFGEDHERRSSAELRLDGVTSLALGDTFGCALVAGGEVRCFGKGPAGELGNGQPTPTSAPPSPVALPGPATALAVGPRGACARLADRRWSCWGANKSHEIGPRGAAPILVPRLLDLAELERLGR